MASTDAQNNSFKGEKLDREPRNDRPAKLHRRGIAYLTRFATLPALAVALAVATFVVDTATDYEIAAATFYVLVVLLCARFCDKDGLVAVAMICVVLTVVSYALTADGNFRTGVINTSISIIAIAATTYMAVKMEAARAAAEQARAQLAHVARVTTLGEMAASIAHEVNQPLAAIVVNANACSRWISLEPANVEKANASIRDIVVDANRASEIIGRIRAFATRRFQEKRRIELGSMIHEVVALMQTQFRENEIALRISIPDGLPRIYGDPVQLQQVVLNLLVNAIDAIRARGGEVRQIRIAASTSDSGGVAFEIEDTGIGIPVDAIDHIFEAFYSSKSDGMGIGLSICRSIIEAHGGKIWTMPNPRGGANFHFVLPSA